jgi:amino acid permease
VSVPSWAWITWIAVALTAFGVLEGVALANRRRGDTLSENIRRWLGIDPPRRSRRIGMAAFATLLVAFVGWFVPHILLSWPN